MSALPGAHADLLAAAKGARKARARRALAAIAADAIAPLSAAADRRLGFGDPRLDEAWSQALCAGAVIETRPAAYDDLAASVGFAFALAGRARKARGGLILAVERQGGAFDIGGLDGAGLRSFGLDPAALMIVRARGEEALWACAQGLRASGLAGVVALGLAEQLDLSAMRRLQRAARESGAILAWAAGPRAALFAPADARLCVAAAPCRAADPAALPVLLGARPSWRVRMIRLRAAAPVAEDLLVEWDHETLCFRLDAALADRSRPPLDARARPSLHRRQRA